MSSTIRRTMSPAPHASSLRAVPSHFFEQLASLQGPETDAAAHTLSDPTP
jgi:hypothetical protein